MDPGRFGHHLLVGGEPVWAGWWGLTQLPAAPAPGMVKLAQIPHVECKVKPKLGVGVLGGGYMDVGLVVVVVQVEAEKSSQACLRNG